MKSDQINIKTNGEGVDAALEVVRSSARYSDLTAKDMIHLQLLSEEMLGMLRQITGVKDALFWIETKKENYELHLIAYSVITKKIRNELLDVSTKRKNEAAKGFMGRIRDIFERAFEAGDAEGLLDQYAIGLSAAADGHMSGIGMAEVPSQMVSWSLQNYRTAIAEEVKNSEEALEQWDELEKSVVANIADEIKINIASNEVEMIVYKDFAKS